MKIRIKFKQIKSAVYWLVFLVLVTISGLTALSSLQIPGFPRLFVVLSGSMEPLIKVGSVVAVKAQSDYPVGEIVTFKDSANPKGTVTHRLVEIKTDGSYITKGDANNSPDTTPLSKGQIIGGLLFSIPLIGYLINFTKTQQGLILLIIIPAVVIIYTELLNIKNEALRLVMERRQRKLSLKEKVEEKLGEEILRVEKMVKKAAKPKKS